MVLHETFPHLLEATKLQKLNLYAQELLKWSKVYNLIGPGVEEELFDRHFLDGWLLMEHLEPGIHMADMGSGAGIPGMVVAILDEASRKISLIEPRKKKVRFLTHIKETLKLDRVQIHPATTKEVSQTMALKYDVVVSRGLGDLSMGCGEALLLLRSRGDYLVFKGQNVEGEQKTFQNSPLAAWFEPAKIIYQDSRTGNRILRLTKR